MHDSLNLEKIARRVEKYRQRQRRYRLIDMGILLIVVILLVADIGLLAPMSRQLQAAFAQSPENVAAILQEQFVAMMSLAAELASLLILAGLIQWRSQRPKRRKAFVQKILLHLLPDLEYNPQAAPSSTPSWMTWLTVVAVAADVLIVFQSLPLVLMFVIPACVFVVGWLWQTSVIPHVEAADETEREHQRATFVLRVIAIGFTMVAIGAALAVVYPWLVNSGVRSLIALALAILCAIGAIYALFYAFAIAPYLAIPGSPLARGDYDGALALWRRWSRRIPLLGTDPLIGFALLLAGRGAEAKPVWWALLLQAFALGHPLHAALRLINFASALDSDGYDEEVTRLLEGAARIAPESAVVYRSLASHYLSHDVHPDRALALTEMMLRYARPPANNLLMRRYDWSITLGVRALALANNSRHEEADTMMTRAFDETDHHFQPGMAWLHFNTGCIKQAQQDASAAADHFAQALQFDPHGASGGLARAELAKMNGAGEDESTDAPDSG